MIPVSLGMLPLLALASAFGAGASEPVPAAGARPASETRPPVSAARAGRTPVPGSRKAAVPGVTRILVGTPTKVTSAAPPPPPVRANPFGVMLASQIVNQPNGIDFVKQFGVASYRPPQAVALNAGDGSCPSCNEARKAGLKLLLNVKNTGGVVASRPPDDLQRYVQQVGDVIDRYQPDVLVVENEENSTIFYTGTPEQYGAELKAGCEVAHSRGIRCANGGLVSTLVALLVWDEYDGSGQADRARSFASRAFDARERELLGSPQARAQIEKGKALLAAYRTAGMDYVNFHWYIGDTGALDEAVAYLRAQTGRTVITNEVGQFNDDPNQTRAVMAELVRLQVPIVVWFGFSGPKARPLMDEQGNMLPTGEAFRQFTASSCR